MIRALLTSIFIMIAAGAAYGQTEETVSTVNGGAKSVQLGGVKPVHFM